MKIYYAIISTPLGMVRIQCTDTAVQEIVFCTDEKTFFSPHPLLNNCILQLTEYFDGKRTAFNLPLSQGGTPFQQKVWNLLSAIPYGKTVSYKILAQQFGDVKAIRAVASANGQNKLFIVVPCHRVIGSNGALTGYAGGLGRKQWLLAHEAKWHSGVQQLFD